MIVIDASLLVAYLLGERRARETVEAELRGPREVLHAPELIDLETLNALRRLARRRLIAEPAAESAVRELSRVRLLRYPHGFLRARIWALREQLSAYDAAYLALAEALDDPVLLTTDAGLAARARDLLGAAAVRLAA